MAPRVEVDLCDVGLIAKRSGSNTAGEEEEILFCLTNKDKYLRCGRQEYME